MTDDDFGMGWKVREGVKIALSGVKIFFINYPLVKCTVF